MRHHVPHPAPHRADTPTDQARHDDRRYLPAGIGQVDRVIPDVDVSVLRLGQSRVPRERVFGQETPRRRVVPT
ncbi:MAG: hypothetical protein SXV54_27350, partial [Chloroflexota bacterium]|nr:hypothetical protein [Chloroflexota bacterium]